MSYDAISAKLAMVRYTAVDLYKSINESRMKRYLKVYGYISISAMFSKGDNFPDFLFAYLKKEVIPKWGLLLKERIYSYWSKFFSLRVTLCEMGGKSKNKSCFP